MEVQSDDSFAWADASSLSDNVASYDAESDSNAVYKKDMLEEAEIQKEKAKKRKLGHDTDDSNMDQKKLKDVKSEPESDFDTPKIKKKKKKHSLISKHSSNSFNDSLEEDQDSHTKFVEKKSKKIKKEKDQNNSYDNSEYLLEYRVKQEQESLLETPENLCNRKKKKNYKNESILSGEEEENMTFDNGEASPFHKYMQEQEVSLEPSPIYNKLKKKHKNNNSTTVEENNSQSSISSIVKTEMADTAAGDISDISVDHKKKKKKKKKDKYNECYNKTDDNSSQLDSENLQNGGNSSLIKHNINEDLEKNSTSTVQNSSTINNNPIASSNNKIKRISDRIRFEDEESIAEDECSNQSEVSKQLKQYAKLNGHLTTISAGSTGNPIAIEENDIWIIKCPREIDIKNLKDIKLTLDSKCKLKLNGQTYDGRLDDSIQTTPLLLHDKSKSVIKNVSLQRLIRYRKRIPKTHIPDHNIMVNNQTNFIPLPETKCRHPLFGINYKKAIKVPQSVAERLNGSLAMSTTPDDKHKKKKHKREKCKTEYEGVIEQPVELLHMKQELISPKKTKKRKRKDDNDESIYKKSKRIKPDPDSAEAWDSEQAIKNNLFGFE